jgi:hypothetical protein
MGAIAMNSSVEEGMLIARERRDITQSYMRQDQRDPKHRAEVKARTTAAPVIGTSR